jgi:crotonobetainyl-CoA:carnitine CoA-transferase CaiB-like acyl-CoA transferase
MTDGNHIFSGPKVLDLASFIAGPAATTILAEFGADVIKGEPPERAIPTVSSPRRRQIRSAISTTPGS